MKHFVLQRAAGTEKVDSWLLTANHYENKKSSCPVHPIGPGKLCCMMQLLKDWKVSMGIGKQFHYQLYLFCFSQDAFESEKQELAYTFGGKFPLFLSSEVHRHSEVLKFALSLCFHSDPSQTQHNDQEDGVKYVWHFLPLWLKAEEPFCAGFMLQGKFCMIVKPVQLQHKICLMPGSR